MLQHGRERLEPEGSASVSQAALSRAPIRVQRGAATGVVGLPGTVCLDPYLARSLWVEAHP